MISNIVGSDELKFKLSSDLLASHFQEFDEKSFTTWKLVLKKGLFNSRIWFLSLCEVGFSSENCRGKFGWQKVTFIVSRAREMECVLNVYYSIINWHYVHCSLNSISSTHVEGILSLEKKLEFTHNTGMMYLLMLDWVQVLMHRV